MISGLEQFYQVKQMIRGMREVVSKAETFGAFLVPRVFSVQNACLERGFRPETGHGRSIRDFDLPRS